MNIFISWAGERSRKTAESFISWLPLVLRNAEPWIAADSAKRGKFTPELSDEIRKSKIAILCLTPENLKDTVMLFEASCLSKYSHLKICTFLLGLKPSDIIPPLSQFQQTMFTKDDLFRLVLTINDQLSLQPSGKCLHPATLGIIFNHYWPGFANRINEITRPSDQNEMEIHSDIDVQLGEMLERLRGTRRNTTRIPEIQEPIPPDILSLAERRYFTLVNELGVSPQEAIKRIMKEMDKKYSLQIESRNMIFGHLMEFVRIKSHS